MAVKELGALGRGVWALWVYEDVGGCCEMTVASASEERRSRRAVERRSKAGWHLTHPHDLGSDGLSSRWAFSLRDYPQQLALQTDGTAL